MPIIPISKPVFAQWLMLAVAQVALGGAIAFNLYLEYGRTAKREQDRLLTQARVVAENMEALLAATNRGLEGVRDDLAKLKSPAAGVAESSHLKALTNVMPGIRYIGVMDARGTLRASNLSEFVGRDFGYRDYFQNVKQHPDADTLYVSPPFKSVDGVYVLNVTRMIPGPRGEFAGIVTASLDPLYFNTLMKSVLYAPDMWDSIGHGDGQLYLMLPEREGVAGKNLAQPGTFFTQFRESGKAELVLSGEVYATKEVRMIAQRAVRPGFLNMDKPLVVAVSRDLAAVFQHWRKNALVQAGLFGLVTVALTMGFYTYKRRHRRLEQQAADARALADRFSLALDHIPTYIYMKDKQRRYVYANRATLELFNCTKEELRGSDDSRFFPPETVAQLYDIDTRVLELGEDTAGKVIAQEADGKRRVYWEVKTPICENGNKTRIWGLCGISTDITEHELLQEKLEQQAHQDYLTGLSNRRHFLEQGEQELSRVKRYGEVLSVFMLDVDHFKKINDTHGHKTGDIVLQRLSDTLRETMRTVDIIGRIGGEEFAILLPATELKEATEVAERLRENIARTEVVREAGMPLHFTVSIGVATLQGRNANLDTLLNHADQALYQAKESGRNKVCVA